MDLAKKKCIPCEGGVPPLAEGQKDILLTGLNADWKLTHDNTRLERLVECHQFAEPSKIVAEIAVLADEQWHHPDLHLSFNSLKIDIWTHKIGDLVESDFIFAAKVDNILSNYGK